MKKLTILLFFFSVFAFSQNDTIGYFKTTDGILIWQKVFKTKLSKNEVMKHFKQSGYFKKIDTFQNSLTTNLKKINMDYKGYGKSEISTAMYISRNFLSSFVIIDFKENKYRITLKNIELTQKYNDGLSEKNEISKLSEFALRRNKKFKRSFKKSPHKIIEYTLNKIFTIPAKTNNDW